ncbi:polymorphic toxin type 44 domain-containing protein [[Limnothrix rosea] IAM M-220]|uniref:polymorphic toxin type 44 domain-containing protein n=1 Tax=[Limnothrix rosea] IAM M-220 TaxID=454133 RepID=UPI00095BD9B8|nr:polymorphic toxin type 44 domain-containing protein [[Limnothrix rosea] IAM M-220]OKH19732.1 hypothetical protein NIES208_00975 [[Limnothrix rosea] IAM M-220]
MPSSRPVIQNNPILTIRWLNTEIVGNIGPDLRFTSQVESEKAIRGGVKAKNTDGGVQEYNKCIYQKPILGFKLGNSYPYTVKATVEEEDPVNPYGPVTTFYSFNVQVPIPERPNEDLLPGTNAIGPVVHEATDDDGPRFGIRTATFSFNYRWYLTADISDTIFYIASEMEINRNSVDVLIIKNLNSMAKKNFDGVALKKMQPYLDTRSDFEILLKGLAYAYWFLLVRPDGEWDHKQSIFPTLGLASLDVTKGKIYFNDIWSNMHYGYIGKVAGFTDKELLGGAALAQAGDDSLSAIEQDIKELINLAVNITSQDLAQSWAALLQLITNTNTLKTLKDIYDRFQQAGIAGLDNDDDSGSISLGSDRLYDSYLDNFINDDSSREFILNMVRRRRKYSPNSELKQDAPEGICSL